MHRREVADMETTYMTVILSKTPWKAQKRRRAWRAISRLSLLCLAAMFFARLVLLMVDLLQFQVDIAGAVTVPACAVVFVFVGWNLREWWEEYKIFRKEKHRCRIRKGISASVPGAERTLTPEKRVTASKRTVAGQM